MRVTGLMRLDNKTRVPVICSDRKGVVQWLYSYPLGNDEIHLTMMTIDAELDTAGLSCPLPILKAKKALAGLCSGQVLRIIATDPESVQDFKVFSQQLGHTLLEAREDAGQFYFLIRKA